MRKTKIVCTLGPAVDDKNVLRELMIAGMNVARINFSHGNYQDQEERINTFKQLRQELNLPIPLLLDTKGPEIRIGKFADKMAELRKGQIFTLVNEDILGDNTKVSISYKDLYKDITVGKSILINDGTIEVKVIEIKEKDIICEVINGGKLTNTKSMNVPDLVLNLPSITQKDIDDITYGIKAGFDYIAASFVRKPEDVLAIKKVLSENNGEHIKVIAKIENREGINNFDDILKVADGIMVARGDLGVEIPMQEVPVIQKEIIKRTYKLGKPVITATQMLESMTSNPRPTRAEVSDVANAIYDGSSAIMLSGETASGEFPVDCVKTMVQIAKTIESSIRYKKRFLERNYNLEKVDYRFNMNYAVCTTAMNLNAKAIIVYTRSGNMARMLSSFGPSCPIYAITEDEITHRQLSLVWNVEPLVFKAGKTIDELIDTAIDELKVQQKLNKDDLVLIAGGDKIAKSVENSQINEIIGGVLKI